MKPQHVVWSSVKHPTLYQNNRFDDETDDDIKRFLDFSKVSRCRSELLPGRSLDAWNCVPLIHLLTLNLRKKYLCLSLAFPFFVHVSWNRVSAAGALKTCLKHFLQHILQSWYLFVFVEHTSHPNCLQNIEHLSSTPILSAAQTHTVLVLKPCPLQG